MALTVLAACLFGGAALTVSAAPPNGVPDPIIFPIVGPASWIDDFGDPRPQGPHQGNDIESVRGAPVVAVEAGKIKFWTTSATAGCMLYLYGKSGTTYLYIHLNNDLTDKNDNRGKCVPGVAYAGGLRDGAHVKAGELIAFVGDSGDADGNPHLHFELHPNDGQAVSPYRVLKKATRLLFVLSPEAEDAVAGAGEPPTLTLTGTVEATELSDAGNSLTLDVGQVALSTGDKWTVEREVTIAVPQEAVVQRKRKNGLRPANLATATTGDSVSVTTTGIELTLASELAEPGTLTAAAVVLGQPPAAS